jgi:hypothetical protein
MEKPMNDDERWSRTRKSAKHFLAAVVFNESSTETLRTTGSSLLSCVGYYYVGFHSAVSMLWLCDSVPESALHHVRHGQLKTLVEIHLVQTKKLGRSFLLEYQQLQDLREYANYNFGSKAPKYEYKLIAPTIASVTDSMLTETRGVLSSGLNTMDMMEAFQATIGDDIGSDLINLHAGEAVAQKVWDYLVEHHLTT